MANKWSRLASPLRSQRYHITKQRRYDCIRSVRNNHALLFRHWKENLVGQFATTSLFPSALSFSKSWKPQATSVCCSTPFSWLKSSCARQAGYPMELSAVFALFRACTGLPMVAEFRGRALLLNGRITEARDHLSKAFAIYSRHNFMRRKTCGQLLALCFTGIETFKASRQKRGVNRRSLFRNVPTSYQSGMNMRNVNRQWCIRASIATIVSIVGSS